MGNKPGTHPPCPTLTLRTEQGFMVFQIIVLLLVLVGIWFLFQCYNQGILMETAKSISNDYSEGFTKYILPKIR